MSWTICLWIYGRCLQVRARADPAPSVHPALRTPPVQRLPAAHPHCPAPASLRVPAQYLQLPPQPVPAAESGHRTSYSVYALRIDSAESTSDSSDLGAEGLQVTSASVGGEDSGRKKVRQVSRKECNEKEQDNEGEQLYRKHSCLLRFALWLLLQLRARGVPPVLLRS